MVQLPSWLNVAGGAGDLTAIVGDLSELAEFATHWREIAATLWQAGSESPVDSPLRLALYVGERTSDPALKEVFAALGLSSLLTELGEWHARIADPDAPWAKLLKPCSDFAETYGDAPADDGRSPEDGDNPGLVALQVPKLDQAAETTAGPAELSVSLGMDAAIECEAGAVWPFRGDQVEPGLLRLGIKGEVEGSGGLSVPFASVGEMGAHVGGSASTALGFFYRPAQADELFAEALLSALARLPSPLDLSDISHAMALANLEGVVLSCRGSAEAGLNVVLGKDFDVAGLVSGTLGVDAALDFRRDAHWVLSLRRDGGAMGFVLSREQVREREWSAGVGLDLDWSGLARRVQDIVIEAKDLTGPILSQIKPFLSPGTYLMENAPELLLGAVESIIGNAEINEALSKDLAIVLGTSDADRSALAEWLAEQISKLAATQTQGVLTNAEEWASTIATGLAGKVPSLAQPALQAALLDRLAPLLGEVKARFDQVVQSPANSAALANELKAIGIKLRQGANQADAVTQGVRDLLETLDAFVRQVLEKTGEGVEKKLRARFGWNGLDTNARQYELMGVISEVNEATARLWRALVLGKLQPFQQILADPALAPAGFSLAPESSLSRLSGVRRGFALEVAVLGFEVSISSIVEGKAQIALSASGDVVVTAEGSATRNVEGFDEGRGARFVSTWDLALGKLDGIGKRSMGVSLALDHADKDLSVREVAGFLGGLASQGLVEQSRVVRAQETYQQWRVATDPGKKVKGRIEVRMALPGFAVERMVMLGRSLDRDSGSLRLSLFRAAVQAQLGAGVSESRQVERDCRKARREFREISKVDDQWRVMFALQNVDLAPRSSSATNDRYSSFEQLIPRAKSFPTMLALMAQIYDSIPVGAQPGATAWSEKDYAKAEKDMAAEARKWLRLNMKWIFWFKAEMHPAQLAFLRLLADMTRPLLDGENLFDGEGAEPVPANTLFAITMIPALGRPISI